MPVTDTTAGLSVLDIADFRQRVSSKVSEVFAEQTPLLLSVSEDLQPMITSISALMAGGKRLRPAFAYWGWRGAGGADSDAAVSAATALEFLQACALIHDDVMDGSDTRRGLPATHRFFESLHREGAWLGSAENFGAGAAILAGDLCLSWADELLFTSDFDHESLVRAKRVYDVMRTELMAGQYLDLLEQSRASADVSRIRNVIRYKSAKYTIERPLHMGAALAGANESIMQSLSDYGLPLGEAFQLRDDVLGVFGAAEKTGKPVGDDLREGKRTVLVALTRESLPTSVAQLFDDLLAERDLTEAQISHLQQTIADSGALGKTQLMIEELGAQSLEVLHQIELEPSALAALEQLAKKVIDRES